MRRRVRVGILGCGGIAAAHAPGFTMAGDRSQVVAVAEPNRSRVPFIREMFGAEVKIVDDYDEVLRMKEVDAVDILLPHYLHMDATIKSAAAGKHVLVEKVMARNVWECDRMIEACERANVTLTVAHDRRYQGDWVALKGIVDSGALGSIVFWKLDHNQYIALPEGHWIRDRNALGGGAVMSCLTHQIDALRWLGGEVTAVTAMTHTVPERMQGEIVGVVVARMGAGGIAELSINWTTHANRGAPHLWYEMAHVCGSEGEAYLMSGRGVFVRLNENASQTAITRYGERSLSEYVPVDHLDEAGHVACIREWIRHLRGEPDSVRTDGRACRGTVEIAEAAYRSEDEGTTVSLPIEPRPWGEVR